MVRTQRKRFLAVAKTFRSGKRLTKEQTEYLAERFEEIGAGADANEIFGLTYGKGRSKADEVRRENLRLIFSWVITAIQPEPEGFGWSLTKALTEAAALSSSKNCPFKPIEYNSLRRAWYSQKYKYLKSLYIYSTDQDSPFDYK